jgi:hypothetical protein
LRQLHPFMSFANRAAAIGEPMTPPHKRAAFKVLNP